MNYTSLEQSKHLQSLGLSTDIATKYYVDDNHIPSNRPKNHILLEGQTPCWTLTTLHKLLPSSIKVNEENIPISIMDYKNIAYGDIIQFSAEPDFMMNVYLMLCWLIENNYIND